MKAVVILAVLLASAATVTTVAAAPTAGTQAVGTSPSDVPTPIDSATPAQAPTPSQAPSGSAQPLHVDRTRVGLLLGATATIEVEGGVGTTGIRTSNTNVDAALDPASHRATLVARTLGSSVVTIFDAAGTSIDIAVLVAPAAGNVPTDVALEFGGNVSTAYVLAHVTAAIVRDAHVRGGAKVDVRDLTLPSSLRAGDRLDAPAHVTIDGGGTLVDALGTTNVHLHVTALPKLDPQLLLYSDDPERLGPSDDGVLYRATIDAGRSARAYVYHVSDSPERRLYLALQASSAADRVELLGYSAGPENAFGYVGHRSTFQYLLERGAQESTILEISPSAPTLVPLGGRAMRAGDLVASIFDLRALGGTAVTVSVIAVSEDRDPQELLGQPERPGDGHSRRGEFSLEGVPPLALDFTVGNADPPPFSIGQPTLANLRPGGRALGGDYGVLREISLQVTNPTAVASTVYFYEAAAGGSATTSLWFTGDPAPTEIACVRVPGNRYGIKAIDVAAGETRSVTGEYMTDGTSYFPLFFGLTATLPSPPPGPYSADACTPKALPAAVR